METLPPTEGKGVGGARALRNISRESTGSRVPKTKEERCFFSFNKKQNIKTVFNSSKC
jgi:hypothetical protein